VLSAPCANKPGLYVSSVISQHLQPLQLSPPPVLPGAPLLCVYTVGCTPNDIIVITHYLTSEATLQMILERIAREALFITTPLRYCSNNSSNSSSNKATRPLTMQSVPRKSAKPTVSGSEDQSRSSIWNFAFRSFALCMSGRRNTFIIYSILIKFVKQITIIFSFILN